MRIITDIVGEIKRDKLTISDIMRVQHHYHESRRWRVTDLLKEFKMGKTISDNDKAALWHAARAELTTQPACIRLAVDGLKLAEELAGSNRIGHQVAHVAAQWSSRYWLEEEGHHEVAYGTVMEMSGLPPIDEDEVVEHRGAFPSDNFARVCILQACVEIEACATYGESAKLSTDPLISETFRRIMMDESQHRAYFVAFAKALIDSGVYPVKDVLAMAYTWIRPKGGETFGSTRKKQDERKGFVNWWERVQTDQSDEHHLPEERIRSERIHQRKIRGVLSAVQEATGIAVNSFDELEKAYFQSLRGKPVAQQSGA